MSLIDLFCVQFDVYPSVLILFRPVLMQKELQAMPYRCSPQLAWLAFFVFVLAGPAWGQNPNVTVDDQPTAEQRIEEVLELRKAKRYAQAAELVQELIDSAQFKLVSLGDGIYADAGRWASDVLMRDGAMRQAYTERYSATAERAYQVADASDDRLAELLKVYRLYGATRSGLGSGLSAAGLLLELGQAQSAATLIAELAGHPDRDAMKPVLLMLRGSAAAYLQDQPTLEEVAEELAELDPSAAEQLVALAKAITPATAALRPAQIDMGPKPISIRAPLWDQAVAKADNAPRWMLDDRSTLPVITPGLVILNNGRQIVAMDRASGQRSWAYPDDASHAVQKNVTLQRWQGGRAVGRGQDKVAAVLGEMHGITERRNPYVPPNELVCVNEQTGRLIWQRTAGEFHEDEPRNLPERRAGRINLQHTHFVGTPMVSHGKIFTVLRRANSESDSQSSWLLAFDADDGGLLWYRHLALVSLSYTNADSMRVIPNLSIYGDTLYMSDSLGAVGAIDVHTGGYRWLRVLPVGSENTKSIVANSRGIASAPVLTPAGLLVALSTSRDRLMLVDPEDGSLLRSFREDPVLSKTQHLVETSGGALAVAQTSASLWDADRAAVAWTFTLASGELMQGRAAVSRHFAVLPTNQRLLVLNLVSGELVEDAPELRGSVALADGELIAIGDGRAHAYTSWDRVYERLVDQVESRPEDPSAGLSLASIAMRQEGQAQSVLLGVGHALDAVSRQPARRKVAVASHVFDQLRILITQTEDAVLRGELYDRLALVTQTAAQEAAYHLDAGLYFAEHGEAERAVEHLHAVIAEPVFAAASYVLDGYSRPAGSVAQQEIRRLIDRFGRGVYARHDAMAKAWVNTLKAEDNLNATTLTAVAKRYPLSPLAAELLLDAAQTRAAEGRLIIASGLFKQAVQSAVDDPQRQHAAGQLLLFYLQTKRPEVARDFLDRFALKHEGIVPTIDQQTQTIEQWRQRIAAVHSDVVELAPLASAFATPVLIEGRLISGIPQFSSVFNAERLYLQEGDELITCREHGDPSVPIWSAKVPANSGELLRLTEESGQVLFLAPKTSTVFAFDAATGDPLWESVVAFDATDGPVQLDGPQALAVMEILVAISETVVCFGHRDSAQVLAIDRATGEMIWRTTLDMTALTAMDADNWSLAAVGRAGHPQQLRSGKLAVLSLSDAKPILDQGQARIALTPFSVALDRQQVIVFGASGVMALETPSGKTIWSQRLSDKMLTGAHAMLDQRIAIETNDGQVYLLDVANQGRSMGSFAIRSGGDRTPTRLGTVGDGMWCLSGRGVFRFGALGELDWSDAIENTNLTPKSLIIGEGHVALVAQTDPAAVQNELKLFVLENEGGRLVNQYDIGPLPQEAQSSETVQFGSGLAMPVGNQTMLIPPAKPGA